MDRQVAVPGREIRVEGLGDRELVELGELARVVGVGGEVPVRREQADVAPPVEGRADRDRVADGADRGTRRHRAIAGQAGRLVVRQVEEVEPDGAGDEEGRDVALDEHGQPGFAGIGAFTAEGDRREVATGRLDRGLLDGEVADAALDEGDLRPVAGGDRRIAGARPADELRRTG